MKAKIELTLRIRKRLLMTYNMERGLREFDTHESQKTGGVKGKIEWLDGRTEMIGRVRRLILQTTTKESCREL